MWLAFAIGGTFAWALVNVMNSIFVHNHIKSPFAINWIQSAISVVILLLIATQIDIHSNLILFLLFFGITAYAGDLWFFHIMEKLDVSILNIGWSILALFLSVTGFIFFDETWTILQSIGAVLIIMATLFLCLFHQHKSTWHTIWLLVLLGLFYVPFYVARKFAFDAGESVSAVFFWMLIGREILSLLTPIIRPQIFHESMAALKKGWYFPLTCTATIIVYFLAEYFHSVAYEIGPFSLVSVIENLQPFFVVAIAWFYIRFAPFYHPKELINQQSITVKIHSFAMATIGLALLGFG